MVVRTIFDTGSEVFGPRFFSAASFGQRNTHKEIQRAINEASDQDGGVVYLAAGSWAVSRRIILKEKVHLVLHGNARVEHQKTSGVCLEAQKNTSITGGKFYRDSVGSSYTGTLIQTAAGQEVDRIDPIFIKTKLQVNGQTQGTGLKINVDASSSDSFMEWSRFDVICQSLENAVQIEVQGGDTNLAFCNGNVFKIHTTACDNSLDTIGDINDNPINENTFHITAQASSNAERVAILRGVTQCDFFFRVFDWRAQATNDQPVYAPVSVSAEGNYRNQFWGLAFYDFLGQSTVGDLRLGGSDNRIMANRYGGSPLLVDSSVANTNDKYFPSANAPRWKGMLVLDENDDNLKYSDGTSVKTITAT